MMPNFHEAKYAPAHIRELAEERDKWIEASITQQKRVRELRAALEQAEAFLERQIACATGGSDISDVDYAKNFNAVLEQIGRALRPK